MAKKAAPAAPPKKKLPTKKVKQRSQLVKGPHGGMHLVLIEDVLHLGKQGDLVEVKPGYGRNYLLPNSFAVMPTQHNMRLLERYKVRVHQAREARVADLKVLVDQIHRTARITIEANSNEEGHLYGSVTAAEISRALKGKNLVVEPDMVRLADPIKECGVYAGVKLALGYEIEATVEVVVVPQITSKK